jgi:hypothetical protein
LLVTLWVSLTAAAQPGGKVEHDWIFRTSSTNWYGIYQYTNYFPTGGRFTTVFFGKSLFTVHMRAEVLVAIFVVLLVLMAGGTIALIRRRRSVKSRL